MKKAKRPVPRGKSKTKGKRGPKPLSVDYVPPWDRLAVRKPVAAQMLDCRLTLVYKLVRAGKLKQTGLDGRITVDSIKELVRVEKPPKQEPVMA